MTKLEQYKIPKSFSIKYEPDFGHYTPPYEMGELIYFDSVKACFDYITNFFNSIVDAYEDYLKIEIHTQLMTSYIGDGRIYYDVEEDVISIDKKSFVFVSYPALNTTLLLKSIGHELGHAIHHTISQTTHRNKSLKETIFCSENIAQYSELLLGKFYDIWNPGYFEFNLTLYEHSLMNHFYVSFRKVMDSEQKQIDTLINLPLFPLNYPCLLDSEFLLNCVYKGYRTYDQFITEVDTYISKLKMEIVNEL